MSPPLLEVQGATKLFRLEDREVPALLDVSFDVQAGECLAIVGESGAGKSTVANLILGVYPPTAGTILMHGEPLPARRRREHRRAVQLVQQNPLSTLNPKRTVGASLRLALDVHRIGERRERPQIVATLLEEVGLPADFARRYPAALSGGQRQRVAVARALACRSELVVLDEPTSSLDVLVQARVLRLLEELRPRRGLTYLFITHDLSRGAQLRRSRRGVREGPPARDRRHGDAVRGARAPLHAAPHQRRAGRLPRGGDGARPARKRRLRRMSLQMPTAPSSPRPALSLVTCSRSLYPSAPHPQSSWPGLTRPSKCSHTIPTDPLKYMDARITPGLDPGAGHDEKNWRIGETAWPTQSHANLRNRTQDCPCLEEVR